MSDQREDYGTMSQSRANAPGRPLFTGRWRAKPMAAFLSTQLPASRVGARFYLSALWSLSSAGDFHSALSLPRYPQDAQHQDLVRIGQDMYRAMGRHANEAAKTQQA